MGSHHDHAHDTDTYFLDQLCLVGLSGAFAAICLGMYFWNPAMLGNLLVPDFQQYLLYAGIALAVIVVLRALVLLTQTGKRKVIPTHTHEHSHQVRELAAHLPVVPAHSHEPVHSVAEKGAMPAHDHTHHHHHDNGHDHSHATCDHDHTHADCDHDHSHADCGHDHGWAPWRYALLLIPIMLFLLGLPDQGRKVRAGQTVALTRESAEFAGLVGHFDSPFGLYATALALTSVGDDDLGKTTDVPFKALEALAQSSEQRERWNGKAVRTTGQFAPVGSDRYFSLARFRYQCCAADAIQVNVPVVCREKIPVFGIGDWVQVSGKIEFRERPGGGGFITLLQVPRASLITPTAPDPDPYIQ